jgi:hypothetical protein
VAVTVYKHDDRIVAFQNKICIAPITVPSLAEFTINTEASPQDFVFYLDTPSNLVVEWGDGTADDTFTTTGNKTHSYASAGDHTLKIKSGTAVRVAFGGYAPLTPLRLKAVTKAISASLGLTSAAEMFSNCDNCLSWAANFFDDASANITTFDQTFNSDAEEATFNENLNGWNTSKCTDMRGVIYGRRGYNQPMNNWDTSKVTTIEWMLCFCTPFNQDLSAWNVSLVSNAVNFLRGATLSTANYDALLISWGAQAVQNSILAEFGNSKYTAGGTAEAARTHLTSIHDWTIYDAGPA